MIAAVAEPYEPTPIPVDGVPTTVALPLSITMVISVLRDWADWLDEAGCIVAVISIGISIRRAKLLFISPDKSFKEIRNSPPVVQFIKKYRRVIFMKDEFITKVLARMMDKITQEQCSELKTTLYIELQEYELEKRCTEVLDLDTSYIHYLQLFLARKKTEGKSERTIGQYKLHLTAMLQCLNMAVDKITENDLFCYLAKYKKDRGVSNVYLDNIRLVFSSFFTWLNAKGYITKNPTAGLEPIKVEKKIKQPFSDEDLEKLRRICGLERDLALIEFLYSTGVRVSELIALNKDDIDFYGKNVVVYGKGSKERETYLNAASCLHLKAYLDSRTDNNEALFVGTRAPHTRLTVAGVEKILCRIGKDAGIEKVHPHRFRRTMATNVLKKGMPLEEVKELLGHTKLDTTMIYCTVSRENVRHSHQKLMSA